MHVFRHDRRRKERGRQLLRRHCRTERRSAAGQHRFQADTDGGTVCNTAISTSSAAEKERLSSHIGGIAGKNDTTGIIEQCYIDNTGTGTITVKNGMVGGVTGYNKGTITMSGDKSTETLMENVSKVSDLLSNAEAQKLSADSTWVKWADRTDVEKLSYNGGSKSVAADRTMQIIVSSNGNLGGVAGYNAPTVS